MGAGSRRPGELPVLDEPTADEVGALRRWDPRGWFLPRVDVSA